jgi:hypothetical protein
MEAMEEQIQEEVVVVVVGFRGQRQVDLVDPVLSS